MYAAAGGASIASRRKQKKLLLNKRGGGHTATGPTVVAAGGATAGRRGPPAASEAQSLRVAGGNVQQGRMRNAPFPRGSRAPKPLILPSPVTTVQHQNCGQTKNHQIIPISPINFPISPPPLSLSLESANSLNLSVSKTNHFPFPPPPDLRVASSTTELQCSGQSQAQGKAAWQGCSRPSPLPLTPVSPLGSRTGENLNYKTKQCEAHRRWMKRNRIRDASYCYGSSGEDEDDDQEFEGRRRRGEVSAAVNTVLYAGLGTTALGLVISFVGTGEKGFQSSELRLVGPSLLCAGILCCLLRVLLCLCLCRCGNCHWHSSSGDNVKKSKNQNNLPSAAPPLLAASLLAPLRVAAPPTPPPTEAVPRGRELLLSAAQLSE